MVHYYGYNGIKYNVPYLWELTDDNPIKMLTLEQLKDMLEIKPWRLNGQRIGPKDLVDGDVHVSDHEVRIENADLSYPILVEVDHHIVDGFHRFTKALREKLTEIPVRVITPEQLHYTMFENNLHRAPKFLQICSHYQYHHQIPPSFLQGHQKPMLFGTPFRWMALAYGGVDETGKTWSDTELEIGFIQEQSRNYPILKELQSGVLRRYFSRPLRLYTIKADSSFKSWDQNGIYGHFFSPNKAEIVQSFVIPDPLKLLHKTLGNRIITFDKD